MDIDNHYSGTPQSSLSFAYNTSNIYNNVLCDSFYQSESNYGENGYVKITMIDQTSKVISGEISMTLCHSETENLDLECEFTNISYSDL